MNSIQCFEDFCEEIAGRVEEMLPGSPKIRVSDVNKNNGLVLRGINILYEGENISPHIYLNDFYKDNMTQEDIELVCREICRIYNRSRLKDNLDVSFFSDYEQVKRKLFFKVINSSLNETILTQLPHIDFMDLSAVVYIRLEDSGFDTGTIMIRKNHLEIWGIDEKTLFNDTYNNINNLKPHKSTPIVELLKEMLRERFFGEEYEIRRRELEECTDNLPMYVVSNADKFFGAAAILDQTFLSDLSDRQESDLYILPSSVHELIIIPASKEREIWELKDMVRQVNETEVSKQEKLSDNVYIFSRKLQKVYIAM